MTFLAPSASRTRPRSASSATRASATCQNTTLPSSGRTARQTKFYPAARFTALGPDRQLPRGCAFNAASYEASHEACTCKSGISS